MHSANRHNSRAVICRIGSLEIFRILSKSISIVICRIGSLEIVFIAEISDDTVICRIGSLESVLVDCLV